MKVSVSPLASSPQSLRVHDLHVELGGRAIVRAVDFTLEAGRIGCLVGPSGSGKTTLLRAIAGFEAATRGEIRCDDEVLASARGGLPPEARQVGIVFQDFALFPHLNVAENVGFGLFRVEPEARKRRVREMLDLVGLSAEAAKHPYELSGGQQQRVALARALAPAPRLLLLDEPFSQLDPDLRARLVESLGRILREVGITSLAVLHQQEEAFDLGDRLGVLVQGRLEQWGTPFELYHRPATRDVADFLGQGVFLPGRVVAQGLETEFGLLAGSPAYPVGSEVELLVRPDDIVHDDASPWRAKILSRSFRGSHTLFRVELASGRQVLALAPSHHDHAVGESLGLRLEMDHLVTFPRY